MDLPTASSLTQGETPDRWGYDNFVDATQNTPIVATWRAMSSGKVTDLTVVAD
jgi:hypothetical protein